MKKNDIRLYNVLFPIWFFYFFPQLWLIILPVNFIVDSLVIYFSARRQRIIKPMEIWKKSILRVWIIGFLSDLIGAAVIYLASMSILDVPGFSEIIHPILFPGNIVVALPGVILAGIAIYWLNRKFAFRKCDMTPEQIHRVCLHLSLWTAPYTMLIPLYG